MIGGIGKMLRLETDRGAALIGDAALPLDRAIQKIPGVNLNPRLIRQNT